MAGEGHDSFLPHFAPLGIVDVMNFVENNPREIVKIHLEIEADALNILLENEIAQDFGGHDEAIGARIEFDVPS